MTRTSSINQVNIDRRRIRIMRALQVGLLGGALAAVGNLVVYLIAQSLLGMNLVVPTGPGGALVPLTALNVVLTSFIPGLGAGLLLWLMGRFVTEPMQIFLGIAVSILLFSFTLPLGLPDIPGDVRIILAIMHVIAAGAIGFVITRYAIR